MTPGTELGPVGRPILAAAGFGRSAHARQAVSSGFIRRDGGPAEMGPYAGSQLDKQESECRAWIGYDSGWDDDPN
jgi:hypothetical protein